MVNRKVLEELLQQPLGPYRDRDILHETACQMKGATELVLYSFVLEHNGNVVGLDESEHPLEGQDNRTFRFRGTLKIANPDWLSDFGLKTVETELNLRAKERALREGDRWPAQLTLEGLFANGLLTTSNDATWRKENETKLTVVIQGEKNMPAVYMHASRVPNGLFWSSKAHNRNYQIATMDVETYSLSENFFWRWRLLALMEKISKQYSYIAPRVRTPIWFAAKYIDRFACPSEDKHRRLIFDEEDTDVDETGTTVTPRHPLRPHTSEILGLFASQVEWLITNNEVKRNKLFDVASWENFAERVRVERKEAAREGVKWGWPIGKDAEESSDESVDEDELGKLVRKNPVIGKSNKDVARKIQLSLAKSNRETKARISSSSESEGDAPGGAEYVSDFSDPSDAEENDSDHQLAEEEAVDRIPWQLQLPPLLPDVDGRWWCPLQECNHQIDLHDLTEEGGRGGGVPEDLMRYILQKQWRNAAYDEKVLQGFRYMVTNHYLKHFEERGVRIEKREGKIRFMFINGRQRRRGGEEPIRGPMPVRGTLGGESRVVPIVHAPQAAYFQ